MTEDEQVVAASTTPGRTRAMFLGAMGVAVVLALGWMAQETSMISLQGGSSKDSALRLVASTAESATTSFPSHADATNTPSPSPQVDSTHSPAPTKKKCVNLSHRDKHAVEYDDKLCLSETEVQATLRNIIAITVEIFTFVNVTYFLESGTLLGSYREKGLIPYDSDADFGIDAAGLATLQTTPVTVPDGYYFSVWNSSLYPGAHNDDKLPARLVHKRSGLYADVFAFLDWGTNSKGERLVGPLPSVCYHACVFCTRKGGLKQFQIPYDWVYPLVDCPFDKHTYKCPRESALYLMHLYGAKYMTPDHKG